MISGVKPLFDKIDKYYKEVNVSLLVEQEWLQKIRSSLCATPDDIRRWEHIRDACREASKLLTNDVRTTCLLHLPSTLTPNYQIPSPPPHMPQPTVSVYVVYLHFFPVDLILIILPSRTRPRVISGCSRKPSPTQGKSSYRHTGTSQISHDTRSLASCGSKASTRTARIRAGRGFARFSNFLSNP